MEFSPKSIFVWRVYGLLLVREVGDGDVRNIVLFGVLIYELVGPTLTRIALTRAGDISPRPITEREKAAAAQNG